LRDTLRTSAASAIRPRLRRFWQSCESVNLRDSPARSPNMNFRERTVPEVIAILSLYPHSLDDCHSERSDESLTDFVDHTAFAACHKLRRRDPSDSLRMTPPIYLSHLRNDDPPISLSATCCTRI